MNTNCLEGIRCPKCGHETDFHIAGTSLFHVFDSGTESHDDVEWTGGYVLCGGCGHEDTLDKFRLEDAQC